MGNKRRPTVSAADAEVGNVVGIDPHKHTLSRAMVDQRGGILCCRHFPVSGHGHRDLEAWVLSSGQYSGGAPRGPAAPREGEAFICEVVSGAVLLSCSTAKSFALLHTAIRCYTCSVGSTPWCQPVRTTSDCPVRTGTRAAPDDGFEDL